MTEQYGKEMLEHARALVSLMDNNQAFHDNSVKEALELQEELLDVYHIVELEKNADGARRMFLYSEWRKILERRRINKDNTAISKALQGVINDTKGSKLKGKLNALMHVIRNHEKNLEDRQYRPRRRFDLFNPEADYVKMTPEFQAYLDVQEKAKNDLVQDIIDRFGDEPVTEITQEGAKNLVEMLEGDPYQTVEFPEDTIGTEEDALNIIEAHSESSNLVYSTPELEEDKPVPTMWKKLLDFGRKKG